MKIGHAHFSKKMQNKSLIRLTDASKSSQVRIIGGVHRGRKLPFVAAPGLRPTGDRMRETVFNWLQPVISGARCLDLFAGSGALGFEAASRGAGQVVLLDSSPQVISQLKKNVQLLQLTQVEVFQVNALQWLENNSCGCFDIVFLDPPFATNLAQAACNLLVQNRWLNNEALVYLECDIKAGCPQLSLSLSLIKERQMGRVWCGLFKYLCS